MVLLVLEMVPLFQNLFLLGLYLNLTDTLGRGLKSAIAILLDEVLCIIVRLRGLFIISIAVWNRRTVELRFERLAVNRLALC